MKHIKQTSFEDTKRSRQKTYLSSGLIVMGVLLLAIALLIAGYLIYQYVDAQNRYRDLSTLAGLEVPVENSIVSKSFSLEDISIDWSALRGRNPDIVAWIIIPGTRINYPIVKGYDNEYYLYRLFDDESNDSGAIFVDFESSSNLNGENNFVYGHNMLDGSMFSDLLKFKKESFLEENQTIFLATPARNFELRAIATLRMAGNEPVRVFTFDTTDKFADFRDKLLSHAVAEVEDLEELRPDIRSLYSFITCEDYDNDYRIFLVAITVRSIEME